MKRTIIAGICSPLVPALIMMHDGGPIFSLCYAYFLSWIFGIPTVLILKKIKKDRHWIYGCMGFAGGFLFIVVPGLTDLDTIIPDGLLAGTIFGTLGLITALCFSFIQEKKNQKIQTCGSANPPTEPDIFDY